MNRGIENRCPIPKKYLAHYPETKALAGNGYATPGPGQATLWSSAAT
jgi:hypothetical protein